MPIEITISLPESLKAFIDRQLSDNGYGNADEYVHSLLRDAQNKEEEARLENLLLEGLTSGEDIPMTFEFWRDLKEQARGIAEQHETLKQA